MRRKVLCGTDLISMIGGCQEQTNGRNMMHMRAIAHIVSNVRAISESRQSGHDTDVYVWSILTTKQRCSHRALMLIMILSKSRQT